MKIRHKTPTLVSMWMLDVFCCALGCVTLLWLLKTREAGTVVAQNTSIQAELSDTRLQLLDADARAFLLGAQLDETAGFLALTRQERDETARQLALTKEQIKELGTQLAMARTKIDDDRKTIAALETRATTTADELARKRKDLEELTIKAAAAQKSAAELEMLLRKAEQARTELATRLDTTTKKADDALVKAEARAKQLEREVADKQAELAKDQALIIDLQGTKAKLADLVKKLQVESEMKFAGIATTGKRAVFLVDMSGSMDRVDTDTLEAGKWPIVCETVAKMMRSLPNLEKFQVILFSSKVSYALRKPGEWLDYTGDVSVTEVRKALLEFKPAGDTNMYAAMEEAFKFRDKGMDTIFFFSDGLPSSGPPLTAVQDAAVQALDRTDPRAAEARRAEYLGQNILRKLKTDWNAGSPRLAKVRINSLGFFYESPNLGAFLWALSRDNDGNFIGMSKP